jgi:hypothetical protein
MAARVLACASCHGDKGQGTDDDYFPRLASRPAPLRPVGRVSRRAAQIDVRQPECIRNAGLPPKLPAKPPPMAGQKPEVLQQGWPYSGT